MPALYFYSGMIIISSHSVAVVYLFLLLQRCRVKMTPKEVEFRLLKKACKSQHTVLSSSWLIAAVLVSPPSEPCVQPTSGHASRPLRSVLIGYGWISTCLRARKRVKRRRRRKTRGRRRQTPRRWPKWCVFMCDYCIYSNSSRPRIVAACRACANK